MVPLLQNTYDNLPQGQDDIQILIESGPISNIAALGASSQTMGLSPQAERIDENHPWVTDDPLGGALGLPTHHPVLDIYQKNSNHV